MSYFYIFLVLCGLTATNAYNIKLTGKVELGKQLSHIFRETFPRLVKYSKQEGNNQNPKTHAVIEKNPPRYGDERYSEDDSHEETLMEKMMNNDQHGVHLYGHHKDVGPRNNVNL